MPRASGCGRARATTARCCGIGPSRAIDHAPFATIRHRGGSRSRCAMRDRNTHMPMRCRTGRPDSTSGDPSPRGCRRRPARRRSAGCATASCRRRSRRRTRRNRCAHRRPARPPRPADARSPSSSPDRSCRAHDRSARTTFDLHRDRAATDDTLSTSGHRPGGSNRAGAGTGRAAAATAALPPIIIANQRLADKIPRLVPATWMDRDGDAA